MIRKLLVLTLLAPFLMAASCATTMQRVGGVMDAVADATVDIGETLATEPTPEFEAEFQRKIEASKRLWLDDFRAWDVPAPQDYYDVPYAPYRSHPLNPRPTR